jgi:hypothetical protein
MSDPTEEANWRAEFELRGENELRDGLNLINHEPKRQLAFRWLREQDHARRTREQKTYNYVRWTFWAAVAAVIVGAEWRSRCCTETVTARVTRMGRAEPQRPGFEPVFAVVGARAPLIPFPFQSDLAM